MQQKQILKIFHMLILHVKSKVDKLDVDKLACVPTDVSKLSNVVKNDIVKKICV